jgi:hypothetical protein
MDRVNTPLSIVLGALGFLSLLLIVLLPSGSAGLRFLGAPLYLLVPVGLGIGAIVAMRAAPLSRRTRGQRLVRRAAVYLRLALAVLIAGYFGLVPEVMDWMSRTTGASPFDITVTAIGIAFVAAAMDVTWNWSAASAQLD